jgi:hypothetical protein
MTRPIRPTQPEKRPHITRRRKDIEDHRRKLAQLVAGDLSVHEAADSMRALHASLYGEDGRLIRGNAAIRSRPAKQHPST